MTARKEQIIKVLEDQKKSKLANKLAGWRPYPKQKDFFALGASKRERLLMAANQTGKSEAGAAEMAYHLTGLYPSWWTGRRWDRPVTAWTGGESAQAVRQIQQTKLLGPAGLPDQAGSGFIPKAAIVRTSASHGIADSLDTVHVRHVSGGISTLGFKSYEMQRAKWAGASLDLLWLDEEPDMAIYSEALTRISATSGMLYVTFTPLLGVSDVVARYLNERSPDRAVVTMTIDDAEHIPAAERQKIIDGYPPHEREARARGIPSMGSGRIFTTLESEIEEDPFIVPEHYALLWSIDPGVGHPFGATLLAWDREADVVHIVHTVRMADAMAIDHAAALKAYGEKWGEKIPVAWPQDATQRREFEGQLLPLAKIYKSHGLRMLDSHATFPDGSNSTEAGIMLVAERLRAKKLRVFKTCTDWFEEYRMYHRRDGQIAKIRDDLMAASRIGIMALRFSSPVRLRARQMAEAGGALSVPVAQHTELSGDDLF
jgi:phage terminase large subunit-like protein